MGLFNRNPNEAAYVGGKKHFADVIKNTAPGNALIWRQPEEDFNTNSTLIVMPGEQAIFIKDGNIEATFDNGKYVLKTENYPFISRLRNAMTGGISTFNCVVYFVRTADSLENYWGTASPIQARDKLLGIATKLRARGSYKVCVANPGLLLTKLIGSGVSFETSDGLRSYFGEQFQSKIKATLTRTINNLNCEILGIDARIDELSEELTPSIASMLEPYGLRCVQFVISAIDIDDDELRRRYDEIGMDAIAQMRQAQAERAVMDTLGDDWARQQAADILTNVSLNPGAGGIASAGAGLGMGMAAGGAFGTMAQEMFSPMTFKTPQQPSAPKQSGRYVQSDAVGVMTGTPGADTGAKASTPGSASPQALQTSDLVESLAKLKKLLDAGLITNAEYDAKKNEILERL